ncbi:MAG: S-layer homology domain-containing protein [Clostridiales bacterium]|nr:S-layer homology domain-containing protein [Clostridiales bacterium]
MKKSKVLCVCFALAMLLPVSLPNTSHGASFLDTRGHWAETWIEKAVSSGLVQGYPDGTFRPDKAVTRAEFTAMVNKVLKNGLSVSISFSDVPYDSWYYQDIARAVAACYVSGYSGNMFSPDNPITRQEAAVIISRVVPTYGSSGDLSSFSDAQLIPDWAFVAFQKANGKGYLGPYDDGKLHPGDQLTRAQATKIMCEITDNETIVSSNTVISTNNTSLSNTVYSNGVTVHADLGNGNATISNCIVLGILNVNGGGSSSVNVSNCRVASAAMEKPSSSVNLVVSGETVMPVLTASKTGSVQMTSLTGGMYGSGIDTLNVQASADITLRGSFPKVNVTGSNAKLKLDSGSIANLYVSGTAKGAEITVSSSASVSTADVYAESSFKGAGAISRMNINASNVTYDKKPQYVYVNQQYENPEETTEDVAFSPKNGARNVSLTTKITITFNSAMKMYDGGTIDSYDIEDSLSLREGSSSGKYVDFTASINSAKKVVTITPEDDLKKNTMYYLVLPRNTFKDSSGNGNSAFTVSFSTGSTIRGDDVAFDPDDGDTGVSKSVEPVIEFYAPIVAYDGSVVNKDYLTDTVIVFREDSSSGKKVPFTATINTAKDKITITPKNNLTDGQEYYLGVASRKFKYKSGSDAVDSAYVTWTVGKVGPALSGIAGASDETTATVSARPSAAGTIYAVLLKDGDPAPTAQQVKDGKNGSGASVASSSKASVSVTSTSSTATLPKFTGLTAGTKYVCYIALQSGSAYSQAYSCAISTKSPPPQAAALENITVSKGTLAPAFTKNNRDYTVTVPFAETGTVDLTLDKADNTAVFIYLNGSAQAESSSSSVPVTVNREIPVANVRLRVMGGDDLAESNYNVAVKLEGKTDAGIGSPDFDSQVVGNSRYVPSDKNQISVTITAEDPLAVITCSQLSASPAAGSLTGSLQLPTDATALAFTVKSNSDTKTYTFTIRKI